MGKQSILTRGRKHKAEQLANANQLDEARRICTQVCQADRGDPEAWILLSSIERRLGHYTEAEQAARRATTLRPNSAPALQALGMAVHCQGRLAEAVTAYQGALRLAPGIAQLHYLLGNAFRERNDFIAAEEHYAQAVARDPDFVAALSNRGMNLLILGRVEDAKACLNRANSLQPGLPQVLTNIGVALAMEGQFENAEAHFRAALAREPDFIDALVQLAELYEKLNRLDESRTLVDRCLALAPANLVANLTAARLDRQQGHLEAGIARLERLLAKLPEESQGDTLLLLGQLYDKHKDAANAYRCFSRGNALKCRTLLQTEDDTQHYLGRVEEVRSRFRSAPDDFWSIGATETVGEQPIFIYGFPRSGTTLLEQILDSHPRLQALPEKPALAAVEHALRTRPAADRKHPYANLRPEDLDGLRRIYFDEVARHLKRDPSRRLVDKMPLNTVQADLIWRLFPESKVILAIRHPCDVCLSCFMQDFRLNAAMATFFSLEKTAQAYAGVMSLWREYIARLPIDYHRVRYEDLVADQSGETARLLDFLGLEWDERVLRQDEHARGRGINTPSYHQVTKPIYQDAKYRWKRYADYLEPLLPILQPYIDYYGYGDQNHDDHSVARHP